MERQTDTTGCPGSLLKEQEFTLFHRGKHLQTQQSQQSSVINQGLCLIIGLRAGAGVREILNYVPGKAQALKWPVRLGEGGRERGRGKRERRRERERAPTEPGSCWIWLGSTAW